MGFTPENPDNLNFASSFVGVRSVAEYLKANGQYLLFESGQENLVIMLDSFKNVGVHNLSVNLDTASLILYG